MPRRIKDLQRRTISLKMAVEIILQLCAVMFPGRRPGECVVEMLVTSAVLVGQFEGRTMNASKIADYVGVARPTVIRKLARMEREGLVFRSGNGFLAFLDLLNSPQAIQSSERINALIINAAAALSRMDTESLEAGRHREI